MATPATRISSAPRYAWLRECLRQDIASGKYPVGSLLPPEHQLAETYGVSRHTVREATRTLADAGLISRHPGIGTVVCATTASKPYVAGLGTAKDLFDYTSATHLEVLRSARVTADAAMAETLGCETGSEWVELTAFRRTAEEAAPLSLSRVYLRPEFAAIERRLHGRHMSIYAMLERFHGARIRSVRQEIEATLVPADAARLLDVKPKTAALLMRRAYLDERARVLAVSSNLYPADRFRVVTSWTQPEIDERSR